METLPLYLQSLLRCINNIKSVVKYEIYEREILEFGVVINDLRSIYVHFGFQNDYIYLHYGFVYKKNEYVPPLKEDLRVQVLISVDNIHISNKDVILISKLVDSKPKVKYELYGPKKYRMFSKFGVEKYICILENSGLEFKFEGYSKVNDILFLEFKDILKKFIIKISDSNFPICIIDKSWNIDTEYSLKREWVNVDIIKHVINKIK